MSDHENYAAALEELTVGLTLASRLVGGARDQDDYLRLMVWLHSTELEFGLPVIRLIGKESVVQVNELFEGCGNPVLVEAVTKKYGPILAVVLMHQQSALEKSVQAAIEHDCENCEARDICPNSTVRSDNAPTDAYDVDTVDAEFTEVEEVTDPRNIDLSKFEGPKH